MIIKLKDNNRTKYYKRMSNGKPMLCGKGDAANFPPEQAARVLEHLQAIDARFKEAELVNA